MPAHPTFRHATRPSLFQAELARSDAAIFVSLAYANPFATAFETRASMRRRVERQLAYVESFCAEHADLYTLARTPAEARAALAAGRRVFVHGIEGATKLVADAADAQRWARRGVAVVTPVHLADNELGGSMCMEGSLALFNVPGCRETRAPDHHGLTPEGEGAVRAMMDAGIVIDLAHGSPRTFADIVAIERERHVAPLYTHVTARAVRDVANAVSDPELRAIYELGGLVGVTANLHGIEPLPARPDAGCPGSIDDLRLHWDHVVSVAGGAPVAWGSDFQGGVDHLRPKYGPAGCTATRPDGQPLDAFDTQGLAHVGLTTAMFAHLAADGSDRAPLDRSAERFLRIWELARGERASVEN
jgi:microsomal dipeptidase-like Zn-dependent dipeptidase